MCRRAWDKGLFSIGGKKICVNCRGSHVAGDQKCPAQERQVEVARFRVEQNVLYAEAVKRVENDCQNRV